MSKVGVFSLVVLALLGAQTQTRQPTGSQGPILSLCSLLSKPEDYDGKEVRVRAIYAKWFEGSYFFDSACKEYAVKTTPYWTANVVWAEFDESLSSSARPGLSEKLEHAFTLCLDDMWLTQETEMLVTGRFFKFKAVDEGYGHSSRYAFKLIVSGVEDVGNTKPGCR